MRVGRLWLLAPALGMVACASSSITKPGTTVPSSSTVSSGSTAATSMTVSSPGNGAQVSSPFTLSATATECSSQPIASISYSIDSGATPVIVNGTAVNAEVTSTPGSHTLHVVAYGNQGSSCDTDVALVVVSPAPVPTAGPTSPASAIPVDSIQALGNWQADHDTNSGAGTSSGETQITNSPSQSGSARAFNTSFTESGGERYHIAFGSDPVATNFLYDGWVYLASPSDSIANLEMDMNQVMANGQTVIFGMQCDGYSGTWDYTQNSGSPESPTASWVHSSAQCNPRDWAPDTWHHVQMACARDDTGNVTYKSVWLDGAEQDINQTVPSAFALNWGSVLLTNFQVDGLGAAGSSTIYLDELTIKRW